MPMSELCDMCGQEVSDNAVRAEMTTTELMCPTSMTLHPACYEQAAALWHIDTKSQCSVDSDLPGLGNWTAIRQG